jgi:hypothetical protein
MKSWLEAWGSKYIERDIKDGRPEALLIKDAPVPGDPKFRTNHPALTRARKEAERIRAAGCWPAAHWRDEGQGTFGMKKYLNDVKQGIVPTTYWSDDDYGEPFEIGDTSWDHHQSGHSQSGVNELSAIMGRGHEFDTVKPLRAACRRAWKASLRVRAASSRVSISLSASKPWVWSTHMSLMIPSSSPGHAMAIRSAMSSASMLVQAWGFVPGNVFRSILTSNRRRADRFGQSDSAAQKRRAEREAEHESERKLNVVLAEMFGPKEKYSDPEIAPSIMVARSIPALPSGGSRQLSDS